MTCHHPKRLCKGAKWQNTTLVLVVAYFDCHPNIFVPKAVHKVSKEPNTFKVTWITWLCGSKWASNCFNLVEFVVKANIMHSLWAFYPLTLFMICHMLFKWACKCLHVLNDTCKDLVTYMVLWKVLWKALPWKKHCLIHVEHIFWLKPLLGWLATLLGVQILLFNLFVCNTNFSIDREGFDLKHYLNLCAHPLEALKFVRPNSCAMIFSFSMNNGSLMKAFGLFYAQQMRVVRLVI